jgi:hypothetical protein
LGDGHGQGQKMDLSSVGDTGRDNALPIKGAAETVLAQAINPLIVS